jgi:hypothetical protein
VVGINDLGGVAQEGNIPQEAIAHVGVAAHLHPLLRGERAGLGEDRVGHGQLPMSWKMPGIFMSGSSIDANCGYDSERSATRRNLSRIALVEAPMRMYIVIFRGRKADVVQQDQRPGRK